MAPHGSDNSDDVRHSGMNVGGEISGVVEESLTSPSGNSVWTSSTSQDSLDWHRGMHIANKY